MSDSKGQQVCSTSRYLRTRSVRVLVACLSALLLLLLVPATAAVADDVPIPTTPGPTPRDRLSLSAYDFSSEVRADVVAGSSDNNLRVDFVAGVPLVDGTIVVRLPTRDWPTDLHLARGLAEGDPQLPGSFVVRPVAPDFAPGPGDCQGTAAAPISVTVVNTGRQHLGVVRHLSCGTGDRISVRIAGIDAPRSVGVHDVGVSVSDAYGQRLHRSFDVRVVKRLTTRLTVEVPEQVTIYRSTPVVVRALRPNGKVDTRARGWVRLTGPRANECIFQAGAPVFFKLTAADAGVKVVSVRLQVLGTEQIVAQSSSHRARPGLSNPFEVSGEYEGSVCSVSYH